METTDLHLASVLAYLGYTYRMDKNTEANQVTFTFPESPELTTLVDQFWDHQLLVDPLAYTTIESQLKGRIYRLNGTKG